MLVISSLLIFLLYYSLFFGLDSTFSFYGFGKDSFKMSNILVPLDECDIDSGVRDINDAEFDIPPPKNAWDKFWAIVA